MNHQQAFTVAQFCAAHGNLSRTLFYAMLKDGTGPRTFTIGRKRLISAEAATEWRERLERSASTRQSAPTTDTRPINTAHKGMPSRKPATGGGLTEGVDCWAVTYDFPRLYY